MTRQAAVPSQYVLPTACLSAAGMFLSSLRRVGAAHARLAQHLADCRSFLPPSKLEVAHTVGAGLGLRTHQRVNAGEPLLRVPESLWWPYSADNAVEEARSKAAPLVARLEQLSSSAENERLTQVVCLALQLLFERAGGGRPFAATLPVPDVPLLTWSSDDLAALAGTRTQAAVLARREFVRALHDSVFGSQSQVSVAQLSWALATITSRALSDPRAPMTLCPVLDLTNHSPDASCLHSYDADTRSFVLNAIRDHEPGDEVTISYGTLDNCRLLRLYGFTEHSNAVASPAMLPPPWPQPRPDDPLRAKKLRMLRRHDVASGPARAGPVAGQCWWWDAEADGRPVNVTGPADAHPLLAVLRVMHLTPGDVAAGDVMVATRPVSAGNEAAVRSSMQAAVQAALDAYPTLQQAEDVLAQHAAGRASAPPRLLHACRIVAGEASTLRSLLSGASQVQPPAQSLPRL
jgi:hypothetical protein